MKLDIYVIRGRGETGDKFQLAIVKNADGHYYQGEYDLAAQYANMDELKDMLATMVKVEKDTLELSEIDM